MLALSTIDACSALMRSDAASALAFLQRSRGSMYYGRPVSIALQLEAEALAALGQQQRADSVYRVLTDPAVPLLDGDSETLEIVRRAASNILAAEQRPVVPTVSRVAAPTLTAR
jgi:hypothetical protein